MGQFHQPLTSIAVASGGDVSDAVRTIEYTHGSFQVPAGMDSGSLTFEVSLDEGANWGELVDESDAAVPGFAHAADEPKPLPALLFRYPQFRFKLNANETADREIQVQLIST